MSFKCAKKSKKKMTSTSAVKETFWTPHPQKACRVRLREVQTPLFVHLCCEVNFISYSSETVV